MQPLGPEQEAYLKIFGAGAGLVLLADLVLLWVLIFGWTRERSLLARRWSAAHVLIAFQAWLVPTLVFMVLGVVVATILHPGSATHGAESAITRWVMLGGLVVQNAAMVFVVLFTVLTIYDQHWIATGLSLRDWGPRAALGFLTGLVVIPISLGLERLSLSALRHLPYTALIQHAYEKEWQDLTVLFQGAGGLVLAVVVVGVIAPFAEEVFFRGFVYRCFRARWGPTLGALTSAALFAAIHVHPVGLLPIFFIGCVLAYLYERTGTLVAPITLHAMNNIIAMLATHIGHGK
jgi:membrane protease YdiL (CAAX protease family)